MHKAKLPLWHSRLGRDAEIKESLCEYFKDHPDEAGGTKVSWLASTHICCMCEFI
jgi:hypothetical protein